ncbi:Na+/H+ antiporter subunit E [Rossellomorea sp. BNER]|uniref:Na+/H+ antiporter subunit E n=1 Tax=Rossellomorea sp. BNER TaxID=2962031 RepID=UPI003AF30006|nr:Na+/H+ antiporter subunit E [Rossellomorea sp. BNER]
MAFQLLLNFFLAFIWMFLSVSFTSKSFFVGFLLGLLIIYAFRRFFTGRFYLLRVWAIISLIVLFIKELILANISVLMAIIRPKLDIKPGIFALPTELKSDWEITVLANLITLTPGTLVVDISFDNKILYIHSIDMPDADEAVNEIKNTFEKAIKEVSR